MPRIKPKTKQTCYSTFHYILSTGNIFLLVELLHLYGTLLRYQIDSINTLFSFMLFVFSKILLFVSFVFRWRSKQDLDANVHNETALRFFILKDLLLVVIAQQSTLIGHRKTCLGSFRLNVTCVCTWEATDQPLVKLIELFHNWQLNWFTIRRIII